MVAYLLLVLWAIIPSTSTGMFSVASHFQIHLVMTCPFVDSHLNTASTSRCPDACKAHSSRRAPSIGVLPFSTYTHHCKINVRKTNAFFYDFCGPSQYRDTPCTAQCITSPQDKRYKTGKYASALSVCIDNVRTNN